MLFRFFSGFLLPVLAGLILCYLLLIWVNGFWLLLVS